MKVSVVIPIYNVEKFIGRCADSLMQQTLGDVEFIFVDDASLDNSISVLKEVLTAYPERNARIVRHEENRGLPAARNTGLEGATGEYVFHCDADDYVEPDMLETMHNKAKAEEADLVYCDFFITFERNERYMSVGDFSKGDNALRAMLDGGMKYNVWNKLVRRSLYTDSGISFPSGHGMGEDMTMIMLVAQAKKIAYVPKAFYHYVKLNSNAYSNTFSQRHIDDIRFNADRIMAFLEANYIDNIDEAIGLFKLNLKFPFLITDDKRMYEIWKEWYPEANCFIDNANVSFRSKLLQKAAAKGQWWFVKLYYKIVYRTVYGLIYK